jgi:PhzF family phenazine biosynthesis protein
VFGADALDGAAMQAMAAGFGSETAFVLAPGDDGADVRLRYFVPRHEMEMCVHATVAAVVLLAEAGRLTARPARVRTPQGVRRVDWDAPRRAATVELSAPELGPAVGDRAELLAALGVDDGDLDDAVGPVQAASAARPKLMVPLRDEPTLDALAPDHERLWAVCDRLAVTGVYAFARGAGDDVAARQFPVRAGYDEDPATGVAACALAGYLAVHDGGRAWRVRQGRAMGRPSAMTAGVRTDSAGTLTGTWVSGTMCRPRGQTP